MQIKFNSKNLVLKISPKSKQQMSTALSSDSFWCEIKSIPTKRFSLFPFLQINHLVFFNTTLISTKEQRRDRLNGNRLSTRVDKPKSIPMIATFHNHDRAIQITNFIILVNSYIHSYNVIDDSACFSKYSAWFGLFRILKISIFLKILQNNGRQSKGLSMPFHADLI